MPQNGAESSPFTASKMVSRLSECFPFLRHGGFTASKIVFSREKIEPINFDSQTKATKNCQFLYY